MIVNVTVNDKTLKISVGDGKQTMKWLATVIQARIESQNLLKNSYEKNNYIVTEIRNSKNQLIHPQDYLYEHATEQILNINAIVVTSFPIDEWENPEICDWMKIATIHSVEGLKWNKEIEAWRSSLQKINETKSLQSMNSNHHEHNIMIQKSQNQTSNFVQIGYNFTQSDIEYAFDLDWSIMKWDWLSINDIQKNQLGEVLKHYYLIICNVFAHYCGMGQVGQRYGLTLQEFGHLLHYLRLYNFKSSEDIVEDIFFNSTSSQSLRDKRSTNNNNTNNNTATKNSTNHDILLWPLMTRSHFTQALVLLSIRIIPSDIETIPGLIDSFTSLLDIKIVPFWKSIASKYLFYTCEDPSLKKSTIEYYQLVKQAFHSKANTDSKFGPRLTVSNFIDLVLSSNMLEPDQENICIASFLEAQLNPPVVWELEYLVLCEFMEALSRAAITGIDNNKSSILTDAKRIRMSFNFMAEIASDCNKIYK